MTTTKISINRILVLIAFGAIFSVAAVLIALWIMTKSVAVIISGLLVFSLVVFWSALLLIVIRKKIALFTTTICRNLDNMMSGNADLSHYSEEDTVFVKINHRLKRLYTVLLESRNRVAKEQEKLQELISDISHQVKTPIANAKMVNELLLEAELPLNKRRELLEAMNGQLDKLDFLMQAMIKTSRLEAGIVKLKKENHFIYQTLATALGGIFLDAEKKKLRVIVDCPEELIVSHDQKWTSEALFNILDNAVKYTPESGTIQVKVVEWEFYAKIDITDSGKGISEERQAKIFQRFYREEEIHDVEGIGIGLYLSREIITMQEGYINVSSEVGKGSTFSVFLPKRSE